jgi:hypothetical protein
MEIKRCSSHDSIVAAREKLVTIATDAKLMSRPIEEKM